MSIRRSSPGGTYVISSIHRLSGDRLTSKSERMGAIFGSPWSVKLEDELVHTVGFEVFVGAIGNIEVVKTMDEAGFLNDTPLISCVI